MESSGPMKAVRRALIGAPLLPLAIAVALACGGDGGNVTSPTPSGAASPTATERATPAQTAAPSTTPSPTLDTTATPVPQVDVTPVDPFEVRSAEAINVRDGPSTSGDLVTVIFPGETAKVLGETHGEAVETGDDKWYQVEVIREGAAVQGFLYAAFVAVAS